MACFDAPLYGRLVYALRHLRGYKNAASLAEAMTAHGVKTSERTVWAIERGEQVATVDRHFVLCLLLRPDSGYFEQAFKGDGDGE